jgi:RNA polymerase sigma-70 factor (ECF subfamily)
MLGNTMVLLRRLGAGEEEAAAEIFNRHVDRLVALAATRLSQRFAQRVDPEDIVQSAFRSFFREAKAGRFTFEKSGDLWRLLAAITLNKLYRQIEFHGAAKRNARREQAGGGDAEQSAVEQWVAREPSAEQAAELFDEVAAVMTDLDPSDRKVLELRLQDLSSDEIAAKLGCSDRTVRRALERIRTVVERRFDASCGPAS